MSQIERYWDDELISEVAINCGDAFFHDFRKETVAQCIFRAQRDLAQQYKVLERRWSTFIPLENINVKTRYGNLFLSEIPIPVTDFDSEYQVILNGLQLNKKNNLDEFVAGDYYIRYTADDFDLTELQNLVEETDDLIVTEDDTEVGVIIPKSLFTAPYNYVIYLLHTEHLAHEDFIHIYYTSTGQLANENTGTPTLPAKFYEETIRKSVVQVAKLGVATFDNEKKLKYLDLYKLHGGKDFRGSDPDLQRNDSWVKMKPYTIY